MYTKCRECGAVVEDPGKEFKCPECGNRIGTRSELFERMDTEAPTSPLTPGRRITPFRVFRRITSAGCLLSLLSFCLFLVLCTMVLLYAIPVVGSHWQDLVAVPFLLVPFPVGLVVLEGPAAAAYWAFLSVAALASIYWTVWRHRKGLVGTLKDSVSKLRAPSRESDSDLLVVAQVFLAILFFDFTYYFLIQSGGADPTSPAFHEREMWENMYGFLNASVWEEVAARILLIGFPLLMIMALRSARRGTLYDPRRSTKDLTKKAIRTLLGGQNDFSSLTVGLIVFSSLMFGFAHAPGWDLWKVLPTAVSGLAFGYIYVRNGVHAAIVLHFSFDYLGLTYDLLLPNTSAINAALLLITVLWILAGFVYFIFYVAKAVRFLVESEDGWERPPEGTLRDKLWQVLGWG